MFQLFVWFSLFRINLWAFLFGAQTTLADFFCAQTTAYGWQLPSSPRHFRRADGISVLGIRYFLMITLDPNLETNGEGKSSEMNQDFLDGKQKHWQMCGCCPIFCGTKALKSTKNLSWYGNWFQVYILTEITPGASDGRSLTDVVQLTDVQWWSFTRALEILWNAFVI